MLNKEPSKIIVHCGTNDAYDNKIIVHCGTNDAYDNKIIVHCGTNDAYDNKKLCIETTLTITK